MFILATTNWIKKFTSTQLPLNKVTPDLIDRFHAFLLYHPTTSYLPLRPPVAPQGYKGFRLSYSAIQPFTFIKVYTGSLFMLEKYLSLRHFPSKEGNHIS